MTCHIKLNPNGGIVYEETQTNGFTEKSWSYFDPNFRMDSVRIQGNIGDHKIDCFTKKEGDSLKGYVGFPVRDNKPNPIVLSETHDVYFERSVALFIMPSELLKQEEHQMFQYNATTGKFYSIEVKTNLELETTKIPSGEYNCQTITYSGGVAKQKFYINNKNIIKIVIIGQPYVYELISKSSENSEL